MARHAQDRGPSSSRALRNGGVPFKFPDYNSWNAGVSYAYNQLTFDLRYYGSDLNKFRCYAVSSDPHGNPVGGVYNAQSNWCGQRVMASVAIDLVYSKDVIGAK